MNNGSGPFDENNTNLFQAIYDCIFRDKKGEKMQVKFFYL